MIRISSENKQQLKTACDKIIRSYVDARDETRIPGVVAAVTTKDGVIYETSQGYANIATEESIAEDTIFCFYSATKIITSVACMQLYERGLLDLDAPAEQYHAEISKIQVLVDFDSKGDPITKPPNTKMTVRMMLSHTAGFSYPFFDIGHLFVMKALKSVPIDDVISDIPLVCEPGSKWAYGNGIDWAGKVVESISGLRLGDYLAQNVFQPLGMDSCTFCITDAAQKQRLMAVYQRIPGKKDLGLSHVKPPLRPNTDMGGQGVFGTVGDFTKFIRMFLNGGKSDSGAHILHADTIRYGAANQLPKNFEITTLETLLPHIANQIDFFPELPKSHSLFAMRTDAHAATGRGPGTLMWAGLANLFYWIDMERGVGGFWATQILPFGDAPCLECFFQMETEVYKALESGAKL
ncbi:hypothetical protein BABINDRAFT_35976 [Babjeviella inositovora NRRL Y-12698]|uniref:Beta-lactamase-related domain-containing protein n=1 Tax=Babjeviella inositovora NRRL Y-12698 TaxID=984486 RepID=A0A1E3QR31_9ASCO|nr:uncharacterized protein BABINDRAFT_35976 [Babjeviella inositovora NRRL Y-12698]ODQ80110.1 hypothetical protein BABINDRAFT_35976 [Babjeviella inositovora NRRL Y-12698]